MTNKEVSRTGTRALIDLTVHRSPERRTVGLVHDFVSSLSQAMGAL